MPLSSRKILLLCPYPVGVAPGQRLKYEQYFAFLREEGYEIEVSPFFSRAGWDVLYRRGHWVAKAAAVLAGYGRRVRDLLRVRRYDGVYVFLHATPFGGAGFERLFRRLARRFVYDIDDLVYLGKSSEANRFSSLFRQRGKFEFLMRRADHVITCTPYLDGYVRERNPRTTDISSTIRTDVYLPCNPYRNSAPLTIGWSGSHSTVPYLRLLAPVLRELARRRDFTLRVIGTPRFELEGVRVEAMPWREETEVRDLQGIDVGLYPLPDEPWVYGKSGLKALQYMALGIPTVATAIGTNFRVIDDGVSGFLVRNEEEWVDRLVRLLDDPALRRRVGEEARRKVEREFSVRANQPAYLAVFREAFGP